MSLIRVLGQPFAALVDHPSGRHGGPSCRRGLPCFGGGFERSCRAIASLAARYPDRQFVYPVRLDPRVQDSVLAALGALSNAHLLPLLDYLPLVDARHGRPPSWARMGAAIVEVSRLLDDPAHYARMSRAVNSYRDGRASERIVARLNRLS